MSSQLAKKALENHVTPTEVLVSALAKTVVRNWLETVRLKEQSNDAQHDLIASEHSWLKLEKRVEALKRTLTERRSELHELRAERAALGIELGRVRQQVTKTKQDTHRIEQQQARIAAATKALRLDVTSKLRSIVLDDEDHE
ncbi:MAG: hypothetical protein OEU92_34930 [Alphaproteobacteria bacterium]|nr:hypothetical protein [Alphaproteobacteria bacterium]